MNPSRTTHTATALQRLHQAFAARLARHGAWRGAALGIAAASGMTLLRWFSAPPFTPDLTASFLLVRIAVPLVVGVVAGAALGAWLARTTGTDLARRLEAMVPASRNLLFTAWERGSVVKDADRADSVHGTATSAADVDAFVTARAERLAATVDIRTLIPLTRVHRDAGVAFVLWIVAALVATRAHPGVARRAVTRAVAAATGGVNVARIDVRVIAPAYTARAPQVLRDPLRIEALEGSALEVAVQVAADSLVVSYDGRDSTLTRNDGGVFRFRARVTTDGFIAFAPHRAGKSGARQVLGIGMTRDLPPDVRIAAPARDLVVTDTAHRITVRADATDDFGLARMELHLTRVSGSGERFTFSEATRPLSITRTSATAWRATGTLLLDSLLQEAGDVVVYRVRAADARPNAPWGESDAFLVERAQPGGVAALGFSTDPDEDRYAVSQQMVILKTERLIAAQKSLTAERVAQDADALSVEQRRVRAEFVFMTGGEMEQAMVATEEGLDELDESAEAETEADLSAGRMVNRGRAALLTAIRAMSRASIALTERNLPLALQHERTALNNLQEAFARQRFLMRALSQREQLDLARRLTGPRDSIARTPAPADAPDAEVERPRLRAVLAALPALRAALDSRDAAAAGRASALAVEVLQVSATQREGQQVSAWLSQIARTPREPGALARVDSAATTLGMWLAHLSPSAPSSAAATRALEARLNASEAGQRRVPAATPSQPGRRP